jgi:mono/diheme cytochrome c family protein
MSVIAPKGRLASVLGLGVLLVGGCNNIWIDPMREQPKFLPYATASFYSDGRSMRPPPEGTVSRENSYDDPLLRGGDADAGVFVSRIPLTVDKALLERGRNRFNITCAACHGTIGDGVSLVGEKMLLRPPPSLHSDLVKALPDGKIEEVIRVGYGLMAGYEPQLTSRDRWAVTAYVRALQASQHAPIELAPPAERQRLLTERTP